MVTEPCDVSYSRMNDNVLVGVFRIPASLLDMVRSS